jgi:Protein-L-isoaspartate carboxylmethyltransferase
MVDFSQARRTMVDSQLRTFDVNDIPVLDAMGSVPRERFVLPGREDLAYIDQNILVSDGAEHRFMMTPMVLARLIQELRIGPGDRVLDVACGRGYSSAVLCELGAKVTALESDGNLAQTAKQTLDATGFAAVTVETGPLDKGVPVEGGYNAILINGAVDLRPEELLRQLANGGCLACVKGRGRAGRATLYVRSDNAFSERNLFDAAAPSLAAFEAKPGFVF